MRTDEQARHYAAKQAAIRRAAAQEERVIDRICEVWARLGGGVERLLGRGATPAEAWEKAAASYRRRNS